MKGSLTIIFILLLNCSLFAQVTGNIWYAKEFSKEEALIKSKKYIMKNIIGTSSELVKFEVVPLAAAGSGQLTTLFYNCESKQKEGLLLGFFGNYWNETGTVYQGYGFKNFDKEQANEFLVAMKKAIDDQAKYLEDDYYNNNIYFKYDDMDIMVWASQQGYTIKLFWNDFDSIWEKTAFERSIKRFEKRSK